MKLHQVAVCTVLFAVSTFAQQTQPGAGNANAIALAQKSPLVQSALQFLTHQAESIKDRKLRASTLDAVTNPRTCIKHRAGVDAAKKQALLQQLKTAGLVNPADDSTFPGGLLAGVFPPVLDEGTACPHLPQAFFSAPGSVFGGHHSYPGGLPVHESNNDIADVDLAHEYRSVYGHSFFGVATVDDDVFERPTTARVGDIFIDEDVIVGAPIWHDWAKSIVFQWNTDGSEFQELNFGGSGTNDNFGAAGDSRTGGHHIMSVAESMARGFSPAFVITQASAHSTPTSGNEYKVVNWLRAAAILAQIDPVQAGYLTIDSKGNFRLPALRKLGDVTIKDTQTLAEYVLHNISDSDFTYSGPAVADIQQVLADIAPSYGYDPANVSRYNNSFRNPVLSFSSAERLMIIYSAQGIDGVKAQLDRLKTLGVI